MLQIPKNVMQIGQSNPHCKIYVEDYVHTFLRQRKKEEIYLAFGKKEEVDGVLYYLIYGAEKKTDWDRGSVPYFKKYDRLGTLEGTPENRIFRPLRQEAMALDGYFIFYEQNEDMQSYMITVREKEEMQHERDIEKEAVLEAVRVRREAAQGQRQEEMQQEKQGAFRRSEVQKRQKAKRPWLARRSAKAAMPVRRGGKERKSWSIPQLCRAASLCLLLLLVVAGVTSANGYSDLSSMGKLLGEAVQNIKLLGAQTSKMTVNEAESDFIIEETQMDMQDVEASDAEMMDTDAAEPKTQSETKIQWTIGQDADMEEEDYLSQEDSEIETEEVLIQQPDEQYTEEASDVQQETVSETAVETLARPESYVVKQGDSLAEICRRFYGDTSRLYEICNINEIEDPNQIRYGQNILLP